jgi:hypothetical protein
MRAPLIVALAMAMAWSVLAQEQRPGTAVEALGASNRLAEFSPRYYGMRGSDLLRECSGPETAAWCQATVEAVMAMHDLTGVQQADAVPLYCAPLYGSARWQQGLAALTLWLPQQLDDDLQSMPAGIAVLAALRRAYPCPSHLPPRYAATHSLQDSR